MNVYDFDKTLFPEDSTTAFFKFLLMRHPKICLGMPRAAWAFLAYACKKITKTQAKEKLYASLAYVKDIDYELEVFWQQNYQRIYSWYDQIRQEDDVVISASPEKSIALACQKIGIKYYMASLVDLKTGKTTGENCYGEEKVRRFYEAFPDGVIDKFYSDSLSDAPLARMAKEAYLIQNGVVTKWPEGKK